MNFAMIKIGTTIIENTIVAEPGFEFDGYFFVEIPDGVFCETGMYYNSADGQFYVDAEFKQSHIVSSSSDT